MGGGGWAVCVLRQTGRMNTLKQSERISCMKFTNLFFFDSQGRGHFEPRPQFMNELPILPYRYIKALQSNSPHMSSCKNSTELRSSTQPPAPLKPIDASDWLGSDVLDVTKDNTTILNTLWALRDHLQQESTKLDKFTRQF